MLVADEWVSREKATAELVRAGIPEQSTPLSILGGEALRRPDLDLLKDAIRDLGPQAVCTLSVNCTHVRMPKSLKKQPFPAKARAVIQAFRKPLAALLDNEGLKGKAYRLHFSVISGGPVPFVIYVTKRRQRGEFNPVNGPARFDFGLFIDSKGRPGALFGSMQGHRGGRKDMAAFEAAIGKKPILFFADLFKRVFPRSRLLALNPRLHEYRHPNAGVVMAQLMAAGKITREEGDAWALAKAHVEANGEQVFHPRYPVALAGMAHIDMAAARRAHPLVKAEIHRIRTDATGMHLAAYKSAGFGGAKKQRLWRLPAPRRIRK